MCVCVCIAAALSHPLKRNTRLGQVGIKGSQRTDSTRYSIKCTVPRAYLRSQTLSSSCRLDKRRAFLRRKVYEYRAVIERIGLRWVHEFPNGLVYLGGNHESQYPIKRSRREIPWEFQKLLKDRNDGTDQILLSSLHLPELACIHPRNAGIKRIMCIGQAKHYE